MIRQIDPIVPRDREEEQDFSHESLGPKGHEDFVQFSGADREWMFFVPGEDVLRAGGAE